MNITTSRKIKDETIVETVTFPSLSGAYAYIIKCLSNPEIIRIDIKR